MKSINRILYGLVLIAFTISCNDPGGNLPDIKQSANARVLFSYPENTYLNLGDLSKASLAYDVYSLNTNIQKIEYSGTYVKFSDGSKSPTVLVKTITAADFKGGKATKVSLTAPELATLFSIPGGVVGISGGDSFVFLQKMYLTDGRTYDLTNSAPNIATSATASFTTTFTVYVGCASDQAKIAGKYKATMVYDESGAFGTGITSNVTIVFKGPEPFRYTLSDYTVLGYVQYGGNPNGYPIDFFDICGIPVLLTDTGNEFGDAVNYTAGPVPPFSVAAINTSSAQPEITINWWETNNDLKATVKLVKQP